VTCKNSSALFEHYIKLVRRQMALMM